MRCRMCFGNGKRKGEDLQLRDCEMCNGLGHIDESDYQRKIEERIKIQYETAKIKKRKKSYVRTSKK